MSKAAAMAVAATQADNLYDPAMLSGSRKVEWHLRVADHNNSIVGLDIRYSESVELPGILSINRKLEGGLDIPKNVFNPGVSDSQAAKDAVEVLKLPALRQQAEKIAGQELLKDLDTFSIEIKGKYLN